MNLAIGTLIVLLLILPGIAFYQAFIFGPLTKKLSSSSAFDLFVKGIIPGIAFQMFFACIVKFFHWCGLPINIDFRSLGIILFGDKAGTEVADAFENIQNYLGTIFFYNLLLIVIAGLAGWQLRLLIRNKNWDHNNKAWRFNNDWYYNLTGEFIFFKENNFIDFQIFERAINICTVYAMVSSIDGTSYIYYGYIHEFTLNGDGSLDTITLEEVERAPFSQVKQISDIRYKIDTQLVIIKASEIINISINAVPKLRVVAEDAYLAQKHTKEPMRP